MATVPQYRLDLVYRGTGFVGWQVQPDGPSVQAAIQAVLATVLGEDVRVVGASRTDAGVHAFGQVATFRTGARVDSDRLRRSLNALLPPGISVRQVGECAADFHPIRSAVRKTYRYQMWRARWPHPFLVDEAWHYWAPLDMHRLTSELQRLVGRHDFTSFAASDGAAVTATRRIEWARIASQGPLLAIFLCGDGFLKQMVRNIVGTLVDIARGHLSADVETILGGRDRRLGGMTAPAHGLALWHIDYGAGGEESELGLGPKTRFAGEVDGIDWSGS